MDYLSFGFEAKFAAGDGPGSFTGYGAVFGNLDGYGDVIVKGAFKDTLREAKRAGDWPSMLLQHGGFLGGAQDLTPIGLWTAMEDADTGLRLEGQLADTPRGQEVHALLKMTPRPAMTGLSIGYIAKKFTVGTKPDEPRRTLEKIELLEVSLVTRPANARARIGAVKAIEERIAAIDKLSEAEEVLRDAGFSRRQATMFASRLKALAQRDSAGSSEVAMLMRRNIAILQP